MKLHHKYFLNYVYLSKKNTLKKNILEKVNKNRWGAVRKEVREKTKVQFHFHPISIFHLRLFYRQKNKYFKYTKWS